MTSDPRDRFIAHVVKDKSFADVGGLWGAVNEKVSVAHDLGASSVTMIDAAAEGGPLWQRFEERMEACAVRAYRCLATDVCQLHEIEFDVVHCSGVLYHHPNPMTIMGALRKMTREHLVLTSAITKETIENEYGTYQVARSGAIFVPALDASERAILGRYWENTGARIDGIHQSVEFSVDDFGPWWWIPTSDTLVAMCQTVGFEVIDKTHTWNGDAYTLLLEPRSAV